MFTYNCYCKVGILNQVQVITVNEMFDNLLLEIMHILDKHQGSKEKNVSL